MGGPAAFVYDFATLYDYVERHADLHVGVTLDAGTPAHRIIVKGRGIGTIEEPVGGCDFDAAAARLAPRLQERGVPAALTGAAGASRVASLAGNGNLRWLATRSLNETRP